MYGVVEVARGTPCRNSKNVKREQGDASHLTPNKSGPSVGKAQPHRGLPTQQRRAWGCVLAAPVTVVCARQAGHRRLSQCGSSEAIPAAGVRREPGASCCGELIHGVSPGFFSLPAHQVCAKEQ